LDITFSKVHIISIILFGAATTLIVTANIVFYSILDEVNSRLPPSEQISPFFVNIKGFKVLELHEQFFPESEKPNRMWALARCGFVLLFVS